jgi:hypothetical protein
MGVSFPGSELSSAGTVSVRLAQFRRKTAALDLVWPPCNGIIIARYARAARSSRTLRGRLQFLSFLCGLRRLPLNICSLSNSHGRSDTRRAILKLFAGTQWNKGGSTSLWTYIYTGTSVALTASSTLAVTDLHACAPSATISTLICGIVWSFTTCPWALLALRCILVHSKDKSWRQKIWKILHPVVPMPCYNYT